jgi:hypothetical protein
MPGEHCLPPVSWTSRRDQIVTDTPHRLIAYPDAAAPPGVLALGCRMLMTKKRSMLHPDHVDLLKTHLERVTTCAP